MGCNLQVSLGCRLVAGQNVFTINSTWRSPARRKLRKGLSPLSATRSWGMPTDSETVGHQFAVTELLLRHSIITQYAGTGGDIRLFRFVMITALDDLVRVLLPRHE